MSLCIFACQPILLMRIYIQHCPTNTDPLLRLLLCPATSQLTCLCCGSHVHPTCLLSCVLNQHTHPLIHAFPPHYLSSSAKIFWLTLCQLHNSIEIEVGHLAHPLVQHPRPVGSDPVYSNSPLFPPSQYLPVYTPSEEEKSDPALFANNVRQVMAK